ncbi:MAG: selenium-dependent xanthine dehydrogenase [Caldilineales bacterium]|nr:selenium-dependent xanthine dehydrogenase [Caldilineales bacterium]MDW8317113.1 selenium-dependent xanthine dehydrogenase [Anaerolineae bacterium]
MEFTLNGRLRTYDGDPDLPLLTYLREHEGIISPKDGCAPQAACGCCAVDLNGKAVLSCVTPMKKVAGGVVTTTEGLGEFRQKVFAHAFVAKGGIQCGFCIPGIVMQANSLINRNPEPSREEIAKALTPHLCRCTGYKKIIDAIEYAAEAIRNEEEIPEPTSPGRVGDRHPKYGSFGTVLGWRPYVDDLRVDGMLHGALYLSDHPRARVLKIDTSQAEQVAGVVRILTAKDVPGERYIGLITPDWPVFVAEGEETRYIGDVLAAVVAETSLAARMAVEKIVVEYEVLPPVTDPFEAMRPDAPKIHPKGNILSKSVVRRGNLEEARARSAYVTSGRFQTQRIEHGYMEPEACLAIPNVEGYAVQVYSQGQGVFEDRAQIAKILGLPREQIRVIQVPNGGAFGGKEDLSVQGHTALAAYLIGRPVKFKLTRDESIRMHPKRHPMVLDYEMGCDAQGRLTFVKARIVGDTGAYASVGGKVLERAAGHATGAYHVPAVDVEAIAVYTNNVPCGAMRGFGVNQTAFALESCIDDLCIQGGFDRWQFRWDNAITEGRMTATGQVIEGGAGLRATLEAVKDQFYAAKYAGLACGIKNTGIGNGVNDAAQVRITVEAPDRVVLDHGWTEMGQGVHTVAVQALCTETGIDPRFVEVRVDTAYGQEAGMTTASRATSLVGNATIVAARKLRADLDAAGGNLAALVGRSYEGSWVCDWTTKPEAVTDRPITHYSYSYATQLVILDDEGQIQKIVAAHDAGKIFNPILFEGQIEGSVHMGLGYAISEDLPMEGGYLKSTRLRNCGILRAKEMPEIEVIGVEVPDLYGPYGAKGVGEIGLVPTAPAVANALRQFDGVRRTKLPMALPKKRRTA